MRRFVTRIFLPRWVWFKQIYGLGQGQLGFVLNFFNVNTVLLLFIAFGSPELATALAVVWIVGSLLLGWLLLKWGLIHLEQDFSASRNPKLNALEKKIEANQFLLQKIVEKLPVSQTMEWDYIIPNLRRPRTK